MPCPSVRAVPYLRGSSTSRWRRSRTSARRSGSSLDGLGRGAHLGDHVVELGQGRRQPVGDAGERGPPGQRGLGPGDLVAAATVGAEGVERGGRRLAVGGGVGEGVLLGVEAIVLVGVVEGGRLQLRELVAQQVDLAGPGAGVAAQLGEAAVDLGQVGPSLVQAAQVDAGGAVEGPALGRGRQQGWWACWPCRSTSSAPRSARAVAVAMRPST